jgi:hypothetical protein
MGSLLHSGTGEDRHDREDRAACRLLVNGEAYRLLQRHVHEGLREFRVAVTCSLTRR